MLAGAGLLGRTLARLEGLDLGYRADGLSFFQITFSLARFDTEAKYTALIDRVYTRLHDVPGVTALTPVLIPPSLGPNVWTWRPVLWEQSEAEMERNPLVPVETGGADYFRTLGIPIVRGRGFLESDGSGAQHVAVVSEAAARRLWAGEDPIGKAVPLRVRQHAMANRGRRRPGHSLPQPARRDADDLPAVAPVGHAGDVRDSHCGRP